jgi:hypothetical protein
MAETGLGYSAIEEAIRQALVAYLPDRIDDDRCKVGDIDTVFDNIMAGDGINVTDGCILDFGGGTNKPRQSFANIHWAWVISGVYLIRYHDDIETALRTVVTALPTAFQSNPRLSGVTPRAYVTEIGDASIGKLNDISFYFIPFFVEALDRSVGT